MGARRMRTGGLLVGALAVVLAGCALNVQHYRETGPATMMAWESATTHDVLTHHEGAGPRDRGWQVCTVSAVDGTVEHYPIWFEDPFVDKGDGRTDETDPLNVYRQGWEDWVAFPYSFARHTLNWIALPVSAVVTPPWTTMESDGVISKQICWHDHDATRGEHRAWLPEADEPDLPSGEQIVEKTPATAKEPAATTQP